MSSTGTEAWLFSYGTLQRPDIQQANFGRAVESRPDALPGHALTQVPITSPEGVASVGTAYHLNARETGDPRDEIEGVMLRLTQAELTATDAYEAAFDYERRLVRLKSGLEASVYVWAGE